VLADGAVVAADGRIVTVGPRSSVEKQTGQTLFDHRGQLLAPGFFDLHVHGGAGADFMDGTPDAFATVLHSHARHGTTSLLPTTTAARHELIVAALACCRALRALPIANVARVWGAHLYGPYFRPEARGCHPGGDIRPPIEAEYHSYLDANAVCTASVAPEVPGAEAFARACVATGIRMGAGHSHCTFDEVAQAIGWGVRHVDHLYCAMSDKTRLRQSQPYPMRGGLLEATLYFDELTTEVIADGRHLSPDLLRLAYKLKGPDRLALVTDCNRALDLPDGEYIFGHHAEGEPFIRRDGVGLMPDGTALASSVQGMDHMVRTFHEQVDCPVWETIRLATLTPARIAGCDVHVGSLEVGKLADLVVLDRSLQLQHVYLGGELVR
jgi:N-acetylglucosamine-6-phosphate deacetylase